MTRILRIGSLAPAPLVLFLALAGCSSDDSNAPPSDVEAFYDQARAALCQNLVDCGLMPDVATCVQNESLGNENQVLADIESGKTVYDASKANACLDGLRHLVACTFPVQVGGSSSSVCALQEACNGALSGTVTAGGACFDSTECESTLHCDTGACNGSTTCCPGTCTETAINLCATPVALGADCSKAPCVADAYCASDGTTATCKARIAVGQPCSLTTGQCVAGSFCAYNAATPTCIALANEGEHCDSSLPIGCASFADWCDPADSTCKQRVAVGQSCTPLHDGCVLYAYCDGSTCANLPTAGQSCAVSKRCLAGSCKNDTCVSEVSGAVCQ